MSTFSDLLAVPLMLFAIPCSTFFVGSMIPQMYIVSWQMQHETHTYLERYFQLMQYKERSWGGENKKYSKMIFKGAENWSIRTSHRNIYIIYEIYLKLWKYFLCTLHFKISAIFSPEQNYISKTVAGSFWEGSQAWRLANKLKIKVWGRPFSVSKILCLFLQVQASNLFQLHLSWPL